METNKQDGASRIALLNKIQKITKDISGVPKSGKNVAQNYKYVTESDVLEVVRKACIKHGVIVTPTMKHIEHKQSIKGTTLLTHIIMSYCISDVDTGAFIVVDIPGTGMDPGDKGVYKALTGSYKYFCLRTFMIPSGDDPERDSEPKSSEPPYYQSYQPNYQKSGPSKQPGVISDKQRGFLFGLAKQHGWTDDALKALIKQNYKVLSSKDLPKSVFNDLIAIVEKGPIE